MSCGMWCETLERKIHCPTYYGTNTSGAEPKEGEEDAKFITREVKYLKEVVVAKDPPVVHVFDVVEHGRRFYRTLSFSSDASLSLASKPPSGVRETRYAQSYLINLALLVVMRRFCCRARRLLTQFGPLVFYWLRRLTVDAQRHCLL